MASPCPQALPSRSGSVHTPMSGWLPERRRCRGLVLAVAISLLTSPVTAQSGGEAVSLRRGQELADQGSWQEALSLWEEAADSLYFGGHNDPRLGIAYIGLATERNAYGHYDMASELYLRAFSEVELETHADAVEEEVLRVLPLLDRVKAEEWQQLLERGDPGILRELRRFWVEKDPTPTTPLNERLIEHWERIAHSRREFRLGVTSPYRTDDRGTVYVRYGPPDDNAWGNLGSDRSELRRWVSDRQGQEWLQRYDTNPSYEVWIYEKLNQSDLVYFLFGSLGGSGPFVLVDGVRDLMPTSALSASTRRNTPGGIRASHYLELFYYADLSRVGGFFARRYSELEGIWGQAESRGIAMDAPRIQPFEGALETVSFRFTQEDEDEYHPFRRPEIQLLSEIEDARSVELVAIQTRVLSDDNEPRIIITTLSAPRSQLEVGETRFRLRMSDLEEMSGRGVRHSLVVRNRDMDEVGQLVGTQLHYGLDGVSTFTLRHEDAPLHFTVVGEELRLPTAAETAQGLRFPGTVTFDQKPQLVSDPDSLELSDLVVGIEPFEGIDPTLLPFPIIPGEYLWRGDPVRVYVEVYHLEVQETAPARYGIEFEIISWDTRRDIPRPGYAPTVLGFDLESPTATSRESFAIGLENLAPGSYHLRVTVTDVYSGQTKTRETPVIIAVDRLVR